MSRWIAPVLGAVLLVVVALFIHALRTVESHRAVVETTLEDFTAFGAERIARELDRAFAAFLLDQTGTARDAHYAWVASGRGASTRPVIGEGVPKGTIPLFFTLEDTLLVSHGPPPDEETRRRIVSGVTAHLPVYPAPAPYVALRSEDATTVVYRREEAYGREAVYGFVLRLDAPLDWYAGIVRRTPLLPRSLHDDASDQELFEASIHLAPDAPPLFARELSGDPEGPEAWAFAPKAGRLAVRVQLDADRARPLVAGGSLAGSLLVLVALGLITAGLIYLALLLSRRSSRLTAMREAFIANVSHDLRTPITQIRMFSETLGLDRLERPDERRRALRIIERQTEVLENLVDNLLHASGSRPPIAAVRTEVTTLTRDVLEALRPLAEERGCSLRPVVPETLVAEVDPMVVTRILTNLVDNAIRHGVAGGPIVVTAEGGEVVTFRVEDAGPGIDRRDRERVLERFERVGTHEPDSAGVGIGLSVVSSLATRHGGDVRIEGSAAGGTLVTVTLGRPGEAA